MRVPYYTHTRQTLLHRAATLPPKKYGENMGHGPKIWDNYGTLKKNMGQLWDMLQKCFKDNTLPFLTPEQEENLVEATVPHHVFWSKTPMIGLNFVYLSFK